ncbi:MAG: hypothetical protein A2152_01960 [Candidatus Levybacteria bacterium RBG_16_35_6]|nr:MAG: hypothetical protein A2152_01960 [Candidatus Levybacteria bacterium RBG_16_35_6]
MTATSHAIVGSVIAAKVGNPALAVPIALVSHVVLDSIPHWDTATNGHGRRNLKTFIKTMFDFVISLIVSFLLITLLFPTTNLSYAFFIIITAQLFDWLTVPYLFFGISFFSSSVYKFQKLFDRKLDKPWGIITQVVFALIVIFLAILI